MLTIVIPTAALLLAGALPPIPTPSNEQTIRERDASFGRAIAELNQRALHDLVSVDVRFVTAESIVFGVETAKIRFPSVFGLRQGITFSRDLQSIYVSSS